MAIKILALSKDSLSKQNLEIKNKSDIQVEFFDIDTKSFVKGNLEL